MELTSTELGIRAPDPTSSITDYMSLGKMLSYPGPQSHLYNVKPGPDDPEESSSLKTLGSRN